MGFAYLYLLSCGHAWCGPNGLAQVNKTQVAGGVGHETFCTPVTQWPGQVGRCRPATDQHSKHKVGQVSNMGIKDASSFNSQSLGRRTRNTHVTNRDRLFV